MKKSYGWYKIGEHGYKQYIGVSNFEIGYIYKILKEFPKLLNTSRLFDIPPEYQFMCRIFTKNTNFEITVKVKQIKFSFQEEIFDEEVYIRFSFTGKGETRMKIKGFIAQMRDLKNTS